MGERLKGFIVSGLFLVLTHLNEAGELRKKLRHWTDGESFFTALRLRPSGLAHFSSMSRSRTFPDTYDVRRATEHSRTAVRRLGLEDSMLTHHPPLCLFLFGWVERASESRACRIIQAAIIRGAYIDTAKGGG